MLQPAEDQDTWAPQGTSTNNPSKAALAVHRTKALLRTSYESLLPSSYCQIWDCAAEDQDTWAPQGTSTNNLSKAALAVHRT